MHRRAARLSSSQIQASLLLPLLLAAPAPAEISASQQWIVGSADARADYDLALLEKLAAQKQGTRNVEGVRKVLDVVVPELTALGFTRKGVPMDAVNRASLMAMRAPACIFTTAHERSSADATDPTALSPQIR